MTIARVSVTSQGVAVFTQRIALHKAKEWSRKWQLPFALTDEQFVALTARPCVYCGQKPEERIKAVRNRIYSYSSNGVDRVDASKGYEPGNVHPCCKLCNRMKSDMGAAGFVEHCRAVAAWNGGYW